MPKKTIRVLRVLRIIRDSDIQRIYRLLPVLSKILEMKYFPSLAPFLGRNLCL